MFRTIFDKDTKLWSGSGIPAVYNTNISLAHILLRSMKSFGSKIAQISADSGIKLTFEELRIKTIRAAQHLQDQGYKPKQVFGIVARNSAYLSPIAFAAFCLGCPINSICVSVGKDDIIHMFAITEPSVIFCDVDVYDLVKECLEKLVNDAKIYTFNGTKGNSMGIECLFQETGREEDFIPVAVDAINDTIAIMSSSGTTGQCKGVCLSHASMISQISMFDVTTADDIYFSSSSLNWMIGLIAPLVGISSGATRIITSKKCTPEVQNRIIRDFKVSIVIGQAFYVIEMLKSGAITKTDLSSVKHMIVAGQKLPFSVIKEFNMYLPNGTINNSYGLTETSGFVTNDFPEFSNNDSVGRLLSGYSFKIVDENGNRCGINEDGEICIKTPHKFLGYYKNPILTAEALDNEEFILTGDIGHVDKDGNLFIVDRKKDIIIYHYHVMPSEVEALLLKSPHIRDVCVVGVTDEFSIDLPTSIVVRADNSNITEEEIGQIVADNMPDYCKLRGGVYFVDVIPRTPSGKILRRLVKETAKAFYNEKITESSLN